MKTKLDTILIAAILLLSASMLSACGKPKYIVVTFNYNHSMETENIAYMPNRIEVVATNSTVDIPNSPDVDGYSVVAWYTDKDCQNEWASDATASEDLTLYAKWIKTHTITYFLNGGTNSDANPTEYKTGTVIALQEPYKFGHEFIGWYQDDALNGIRITEISDRDAKDFKLYAKWAMISSEMAIMTVDTDEGVLLSQIDRENYVDTHISLLNTEASFILNNERAEFKGRGNGSWDQDKKGYKIKFNSKQRVFGNAASKHWVLVPGTGDPTMVRNGLAYHLVNTVLDKIEYTTSVNYVELYVNGEYRGVYSLFEQVRVDDDRVDIESEYGELDTGYLIEYDAYAYNEGEEGVNYFRIDGLKYPFAVKSPDPEEYMKETTKEVYMTQVAYIQDYVQQVVDAVLKQEYLDFADLVDVGSFVDMYLIHELFKNTDTGWSSFYLYKKPGDRLYCGPTWDFDFTIGISRGDASYEGIYVGDKVLECSDFTASEIYIALMQNPSFIEAVKSRWNAVSLGLVQGIDGFIEKYSVYERSFHRELDFWHNGALSWVTEIDKIVQWLKNRIGWLDMEWALS